MTESEKKKTIPLEEEIAQLRELLGEPILEGSRKVSDSSLLFSDEDVSYYVTTDNPDSKVIEAIDPNGNIIGSTSFMIAKWEKGNELSVFYAHVDQEKKQELKAGKRIFTQFIRIVDDFAAQSDSSLIRVTFINEGLKHTMISKYGYIEDPDNPGDCIRYFSKKEKNDALQRIADRNKIEHKPKREAFSSGEFIGASERYQILELLSFNNETHIQVFSVMDTKTGLKRIAKVLPLEYLKGFGQHAASLINEGQILAKFNHENIVTVHDQLEATTADGQETKVIILEHLEGVDFEDWITDNIDNQAQGDTFALRRRIMEILQKVGNAVDYLNSTKIEIAHHDLKPQNVMVGSTIKVFDFGYATKHGERHWGLSSYYREAYTNADVSTEGGLASPQSEVRAFALIALRALLAPSNYFKSGEQRQNNLPYTPEQLKALKIVFSKALQSLGELFSHTADFEMILPEFASINEIFAFRQEYASTQELLADLEQALFLGHEDESPTNKRKRRLETILDRYRNTTQPQDVITDTAEDETKLDEENLQQSPQSEDEKIEATEQPKEKWTHRLDTRDIRLWRKEASELQRKNLLARVRWLMRRWREGEFGLVNSLLDVYRANQSKTYLTEREKQDMRDFRDMIGIILFRIVEVTTVLTGYALVKALSFIIKAGIVTGYLVLPPLWKHGKNALPHILKGPGLVGYIGFVGIEKILSTLFVQTEKDKLQIELSKHGLSTYDLSEEELRNLLAQTEEAEKQKREDLAQRVDQAGGQTNSFFWGEKSIYQLERELERIQEEKREAQQEAEREVRKQQRIAEQKKQEEEERLKEEARMATKKARQLEQQWLEEKERISEEIKAENNRKKRLQEEIERQSRQPKQKNRTKPIEVTLTPLRSHSEKPIKLPQLTIPSVQTPPESSFIFSSTISDEEWNRANKLHEGEVESGVINPLLSEETRERLNQPRVLTVHIPSPRPNRLTLSSAKGRLGSEDPTDLAQAESDKAFRTLIEKLKPQSVDPILLERAKQRLVEPDDAANKIKERLETPLDADKDMQSSSSAPANTPTDRLSRDNWGNKDQAQDENTSGATSRLAMTPK